MMIRGLFCWTAYFVLAMLSACGGGGSDSHDAWQDFNNRPWEEFPLAGKQVSDKANEPRIPQEVRSPNPAFFPDETVSQQYLTPNWMAQHGFTHGVVMINATMVYPRDRGFTALVEIRNMRFICRDPTTGGLKFQQEVRIGLNQEGAQGHFVSETYSREPGWFTSGVAQTKMVPKYTSVAAAIDLRTNPMGIFHAWTEPRFEFQPGCDYLVEVTARVTGDARIQVGMDSWKGLSSEYNGWSEGCATSNNCQAFLGDWWGDTAGLFITFRAPIHLH